MSAPPSTGCWAAEVAAGADELLLGFARALHAAGIRVTADRERIFLDAVTAVGMGRRRDVYWAGRATLCCGPHDFERYDQVFAAWFGAERPGSSPRQQQLPPVLQAELGDSAGAGGHNNDEDAVRAAASATELLRHRDLAELPPGERALLSGLFARLSPRSPRRRARRHTAWHHGQVDGPATLRRHLRTMGEPGPVACVGADSATAKWCCSSTSPAPWGPTPTRCCGWPTATCTVVRRWRSSRWGRG